MTPQRAQRQLPPLETQPLTKARMALPPHDMPGVVVTLTAPESLLLLDWMIKSSANLEAAIEDDLQGGREVSQQVFVMFNTVNIGIQSCHSAAAASAIYDQAEPADRLHFIHFNQFDAVTIIEMLENTGSDVAEELHSKIIAQVDHAFIKKDVFANLP